VGAAAGGVSTTIRFDDRDVDFDERTVQANLDYRIARTVSVSFGVGAILDGNLRVGDTDFDIETGVAGTVAASWLALPEGEVTPFLLVGLGAGASTTKAGGERLTAIDVRGSVVVGKTFLEQLTPYVVGRVFGGPVRWTIAGASVTGGDTHHYTVGVGTTLRVSGLDLFAEVLPLGERALNVGLGWSF